MWQLPSDLAALRVNRTPTGFAKRAKEAMRKAGMKLPTPCRIEVTKGLKLLAA